jgi:hypothetical protein
LTLAAVLIGGLGLLDAQTAAAARPVRRTARPEAARGFNLFAGAVNVMMNTNRIACNINNIGEQCVNPGNSSVVAGGYWPKGTPDQYIFNGGLQIAAIIPGVKTATFPWPGDTVGAYFFDARGDQAAGQGLTNVYNSLNATDLAEWPTAAYVNDPTLFNAALLGRKTISQQDSWVRYWDGSVNLLTGRQHPMGLLVDQRAMMWNFPSGNQDIMYFLMRFINITANDATRYQGLSAFGYSASDIADIVQIGRNFRAASQAQFGVTIPDTGYAFANMYAGYGQDPDEGNSGVNYSTASLPFQMAYVYKANMSEPTWSYPANIFGAPFAPAPGMEGVKYLKSPTNPATGQPFGVTMFTNTTNGGAFPDRFTVQALWRLASNNLDARDGSCNAPVGAPLCQLVQTYSDTRMYMYSGPMTIKPGESAVIVVAMVHAAPVSAAIQNDGNVLHPLGNSAYDLKPGFPGTLTGYLTGIGKGQTGATGVLDTVRQIDRAVGWVSATPTVSPLLDLNANGRLEQSEIPTIPRSLLHKSMVAQAVFNAQFLLPFSPEGPSFFTVPGDNQVTVVWQPSATESAGDPYFAVASNPLNSLYDPNFRRYDVEGYRIWRGRTEAEMQVIASFDYARSTITDYTGGFFYSDYPQCAPELGLAVNCPVVFNTNGTGETYAVNLSGNVVQIPSGGRTQLRDLSVFVLTADTAVTGGASGLPGLTDNGVPFAYNDASARNGFRYFYAVTAFDINSVNSGPSSLESPLNTKQATPRAGSGQEVVGTLTNQLFGADGNALDLTQALPALNATTGIFSGPMPPTNGAVLGFAAFVPQVLSDGGVAVTIDSIVPGAWLVLDYTNAYIPAKYYLTITQGAGAPVARTLDLIAPETGGDDGTASYPFVASVDSAMAARYAGNQRYTQYKFNGNLTLTAPANYRLAGKTRANVNSDPSGKENGPRWWTGAANENTNNPNGITCVTVGSYTCTLADLSRNAGAMTGVGIFNIVSYNTIASSAPARDIEGSLSSVYRAADFKWFWGANGAVDSVVDVTHHVRVPFSPKVRASWGILNDSSFVTAVSKASMADTSIDRVTWSDYACVAPFPAYFGICGGAANWPAGAGGAVFQNHARLNSVNFASSSYAGTAALSGAGSDGKGFIVYLAGNFFLMKVASFPATGTVWNMRTYAGNIAGAAGSFSFNSATRPPAVPGLRMKLEYTGSTMNPAVTTSDLLARIHTVPDPYYVTNGLEITANTKVLRFVNLPAQAIIRIYSVSGILVNVLTHNDAGGGGEEVWNLRNRNNQFVASGVYFYHVETPDGQTKIGRLTVVNYAQ